MSKIRAHEAIVIGSGPNGLAAAIKLAQAGIKTTIYEAKNTVGGGTRSAELTLPGFIHDICSAIHPTGIGSPFFRDLPLIEHGLEWIHPQSPLAHPFDDGTAAILERSIDETSKTLENDGLRYKKFMEPLVENWPKIESDVMGPFGIPKHPLVMARFGIQAIQSAKMLSNRLFKAKHARGLFAGLAAHSMMPLDWLLTSGIGIALAIFGHVYGWPISKKGSQKIADALASYFSSLGGEIITNYKIEHIDQLPSNQLLLFDVSPRQLLQIAGNRLPLSYQRKLQSYRYNPGVFKVDWALNCPIPWKAKECLRAGTVHLGGTQEEIEESESEVWKNRHPKKPFIILAQQSLFDQTRAPEGKHTAWGYCHVPNGSTIDMTEVIEAQIERFAPGFCDCILKRSTMTSKEFEQYNPNYIGGDINGGVQDIYQFLARPTINTYSTPDKNIYICSSSTPPGGGVHGMCGFHAAKRALKENFNL